jgi:ABC-2 type transport system permease protein
MALAFGGLAFLLAQFLGRAPAAWIAGFVLVAGPILNNYKTLLPAFRGVAQLTPWAWTANHLPLAGQDDWGSLVPVAILAAVLLPLGIEAFARRDLGASSALPTPGLPAVALGLRGPVGRSLGERLPLALAWGLGLGAFGLAMAAGSRSLADAFATSPDLARTVQGVFPGFDLTSAGGFLQLMVQLLYVVAGFAVVTLVSGWAADETSGRLELLLASPISRRSWALRSGLGVLAAIALMTLTIALATGLGAALAGSDALTPMAGTLALGLFAAALAGVGVAVAGLVRPSVAPGRWPWWWSRPTSSTCSCRPSTSPRGCTGWPSPPTWASPWSACGMPRASSPAWCSPSAGWPSGPRASPGGTCATDGRPQEPAGQSGAPWVSSSP